MLQHLGARGGGPCFFLDAAMIFSFSPFRWLAVFLSALAVLSPDCGARAQSVNDDDIRLRLDQDFNRQGREREEKLLEEADAIDVPLDRLEIDGRTYSVGDNVHDIGRALYISIQRKDWRTAARFLGAYLRFDDRDPMLVLYAQGGLARARGDLAAAETRYRDLLRLQHDFLPGQLELARVLFENRKDKDARQAFEKIRAQLDAQRDVRGDQALGVLRTVDAFLGALRQRRSLRGSVAFGPSYNSNLNQSSASQTCLFRIDNGECLVERTLPDAIKAAGLDFEGNVGARLPLGGHHGVKLRAVAYGDIYPDHHDYSQTTVSAEVGYDYQTARNTISFTPTFDVATLGWDALYTAVGGSVTWTHALSIDAGLTVEARVRDFTYRRPSFRYNDGLLTEAYLTGWRVYPGGWVLIGGADFSDKQAGESANAYRQAGLRAGVKKSFGDKAELLTLVSLRYREYGGFNALLDDTRRDVTQNYTLILGRPAWRIAGLTPELKVDYLRVNSTVSWLYSYDRIALGLRMKHAF